MKNWKVLNKQNYKKYWDFVYYRLQFEARGVDPALINLPKPNKKHNIKQFYGKKFNESLYDDLHKKSLKVFQDIFNNKVFALDWQHECYSFDPNLPCEKNEFDEWLIPIFPNGEHVFFLEENCKDGVFVDGFDLSISLFGKEIIESFAKHRPKIFEN